MNNTERKTAGKTFRANIQHEEEEDYDAHFYLHSPSIEYIPPISVHENEPSQGGHNLPTSLGDLMQHPVSQHQEHIPLMQRQHYIPSIIQENERVQETEFNLPTTLGDFMQQQQQNQQQQHQLILQTTHNNYNDDGHCNDNSSININDNNSNSNSNSNNNSIKNKNLKRKLLHISYKF